MQRFLLTDVGRILYADVGRILDAKGGWVDRLNNRDRA
jgi:hypothetical protein